MAKTALEHIGIKNYNKRNQETIQAFYKDFFSYSAENIGAWLVAGIMEVVLGIFMLIPYQEVVASDGELLSPVLIICIWGAIYYMVPYISFREDGKRVRIYDKLKYLPISLQEVRIFIFSKLAVFCLRAFLIFFVGQLFFALVCFHEICWGNIWQPIAYGLLLPLGIGSVMLWHIK